MARLYRQETLVFERPTEAENLFSPPQKLDLKQRIALREKFKRVKAECAPRKLAVQREKFPPIFYIPHEKIYDLGFHVDLVSALVCGNVLEFKKRFPSMPRMVIASTLGFSQQVLESCYFGIMPIHKVWFLTWEPFLPPKQQKSEGINAVDDTFGSFNVSKLCNYIMLRGRGTPPQPGDDEKKHHAVVRKYMNESHNHKTIAQLSQASAVILVQCPNAGHETSVDPVFLSIYRLFCAMQPNFRHFAASNDSNQKQTNQTDQTCRRKGAPTVFVVAGMSRYVRLQYTLMFRSGSSLLISKSDVQPVVQNNANGPLCTFYGLYRAVHRVICNIEQFVLYFCHHVARKNGARFVVPTHRFRLRDPGIRHIGGICEQIKNFFEYVIRDTNVFKKDGAFDLISVKAMFDCIESNLKGVTGKKKTLVATTAPTSEAAAELDTEIKVKDLTEAELNCWRQFATHKNRSDDPRSSPFDSEYNFFLNCSKCAQQKKCTRSEEIWNRCECPEDISQTKEDLLTGFSSLLHVFSHIWWEPLQITNQLPSAIEENREFYNPIQEIQQICESGRVFQIPDLKPAFLSFAFSRIAIELHHSTDVRFLGETALMHAACNGSHDIDMLLQQCSVSQVLSKSEHPQANGLDALFMSIFFLRIDVAEKIVDFILKSCSNKSLHVHPFCAHPFLRCTTFMLACRHGSAQLLNKLFELLELWVKSSCLTTDKTYVCHSCPILLVFYIDSCYRIEEQLKYEKEKVPVLHDSTRNCILYAKIFWFNFYPNRFCLQQM